MDQGMICMLGNPLVDMVFATDNQLVSKYGLPQNGEAELDRDKHRQLLQDLGGKTAQKTPGGAALNSARVAQWVLGKNNPRVVTFMGCIGEDEPGSFLATVATEANVRFHCQKDPFHPTGSSIALIDGDHRCLCADTGAAKAFDVNWLKRDDNLKWLDRAKIVYIEGFLLVHSFGTVLFVAQRAQERGRVVVLNLSSTYVVEANRQNLVVLYSYVDIVVGNKQEMESFYNVFNTHPTCANSTEQKLKFIATIQRNSEHDVSSSNLVPNFLNYRRIVVVTDASNSVQLLYTTRDNKVNEREHSVPTTAQERVVDGVGCGDAFVGALLATLLLETHVHKHGDAVSHAVDEGIRAAVAILQQSACTIPTYPFSPRLVN